MLSLLTMVGRLISTENPVVCIHFLFPLSIISLIFSVHQFGKGGKIVEARYERGSTIFCSQFAPPGWHERIAEDALADAVLDRIENSSYKILIDGDDSMRKRKGFQSE